MMIAGILVLSFTAITVPNYNIAHQLQHSDNAAGYQLLTKDRRQVASQKTYSTACSSSAVDSPDRHHRTVPPSRKRGWHETQLTDAPRGCTAHPSRNGLPGGRW